MTNTCLEKQQLLEEEFRAYASTEAMYRALMEWGKRLPPYPPEHKKESCLVSGCQSILHLYTELRAGKVYFTATTDALISAGLAALLVHVYSGETPQTLFTHPPLFLKNVGILEGLTPGRAQGVASLYNKMRHDVAYLVTQSTATLNECR